MVKYKVRNCALIDQIINIEDITQLVSNGFLIVKVKTINPDEVSDVVELMGELLQQLPENKRVPCVVIPNDVEIMEVLAEAEETENGRNE